MAERVPAGPADLSVHRMSDMTPTRPNLSPLRCKAALLIRRKTLLEVAQAGGVTLRHLLFVLAGQRSGSQRVYQALCDVLGPAGWAFATGASDTLCDEGAPHASA